MLTDKGQWAAPEAVKTDVRTIRITAGGNIVAVRYNWADYPCGNLFGPTGLPVALFEVKMWQYTDKLRIGGKYFDGNYYFY